MVRETRHLWVGNLPENIREDRIREHFKRYGRVQSVKLLPRGEDCPVDGGSSSSLGEGNEGGSGSSSGGGGGGGGGGSSTSGGASATVAFMDIKSAAKAHATEHTLDERALTTQYYEPQHLQHRFPSHGSSEDHGSGGGSTGGGGGTGGVSGGGSGGGSTGTGVGGNGGGGERDRGSENFDSRGSHGSFYGSERSNRVVGTGSGIVGGGSSGSGGVGGHSADPSTADPGGYISRSRPPPATSYHVTSSRARDRLYPRTGPYVSGPPPPPHLDRHRGSLPPSSWSTYEPTSSRYGGVPPPPSPATNDAYQDEQGGGGSTGALRQHKKQRRKSRSGSSSPSGSSRSGSSSSSRSGSSGGSSSGGSTSPGSSPHRTSNVAVTEDRRPLAICVRNLPARSSDTSLKDGLFHEYKKHGKVTWVKVVGAAGDRYALVCFKKPEDVEKALEVSQDKLFFGCKIEVAPYQGYDVEDNEFRPYEAELDEYHPKATRTLFIGNLEKDVTASELRKHFESFGEIIEIDIKKQGAVSSYAFCQYSDIGSVVKAMRSMDGEHLGANRIKLGFGKSMPTPCVWVDGIGDCMSEKYLSVQFHQFGPITQVSVDRERGHALVFFDQISCAQAAVKEMRGAALRGRRLQVDFASRECQDTFYEHLERQGNASEKPWDSRPSPASSFDVTIPSRRERSSFDSAVTVSSSSNRFTRYDTPPRSRTANYSRTSGGSTPGASPAHPTAMSRSSRRSYQDSYYDADYGEPTSRRFRSYDEFSQGSGASHDDYQSSVLSDGKLNDDDCPPPSRRHTVQSVVTSIDPPAPPPPLLPPPDIRHLQKERVHLLEQLEECHSSGDEIGFVPKKRAKLDSSSTILCEDDEPEIASLLVTSHPGRKSLEFRRDSKILLHHSTRRGSCEGRGPGPCKRRRDTTSRHHEHHDGSRPGTPLVDERPENLVPSEPRRFRERSHEGPLSLPLPRFAAQMLNNNNNTSSSNNNNGSSTRSSSASLAKVASPPCASLSTAPSPRAAPQPPASPPPRHASSSPTSSDSETAPQSPSLEERIRSLDEKYEKWSGSRALSAAGGDALAKLDASASERFRFRHKLLDMDLHEVQPSDIVKSVLAKRSVFDEDSKRLENFNEKYEPREFTGVIGVSSMIGSTAGLTTSGSCTSKVCLQYPFPSHPPVQPTSGTSVSQVGINTSLSASLTATTTSITSSMLKTDPRMVQHNCIHPTPATPITPGTSIKTVSPELPPVSLPIGLISGTAANSGNGSGLASASSLLSSSGSIGSIHTLGASTHRGLSISATIASPTVTVASTDAFSTAITTAAVPVVTPSTVTATTTTSVTGAISSMTTTSSIAPPSSITSSSNSSSSSSLSTSSTDSTRSRLRKETSGSSRESRDSRDGKDSRESKHSKGKDCQKRSRKEEADVERNRKDKDERESSNVMNDIGNIDNHRDFKENKELRYERKEREEKERKDKEDRDRQERRDKEDRDRQEKKEREERERREKDEERREKERQDKERLEKDRREREERERERKEKEENELKEKERREKERIDRERREREEKERQERKEREERERREREERERKEREIRLEREKQEKERLKKEKEEQERREKEERDRLERERRREEKERLERERKREREEKERLERERRKEKEEREKMEKEKREKEERERLEKLEREKHEKEKRREREDQERREKEKAEREKRRDREEKDKEKRERDDSRRQSIENHLHPSITQSQNQVAPAPVPIKRRCSSQDCPTDEDAKRVKLSDHRRDSKDRSRQNRRSEDRKHRNDSHRSSRESRESRDSKESSNAVQDSRDSTHSESTRENNSRDSGNKEKQKSKRNRLEKESRERSPRVLHESDKEFLSKLELSKRNDSSPSTEQSSVGTNHRDAQHQQQSTVNSHSDVDDGPLSTHEIQARNPSATDTDSDEPKKHSIFDIVDDEPAYISMYDKVKARSTKNMQKLEEEKRQVRLKDKFSQLKQSRARREEKKQSTSWDGDSVSSKALTEDEATSESDSTRTKSLSRKGSRSRIHSDTSEEEEPFNNKVRKPVKTERFLESDVDLGFADTEEKQNPLEASNVVVNSVHTNIKEEPRTSDEDERVAVSFRTNHPTIVNNHERDSRKKSHKKKQKRQKNSISSEDNLKVEPNVVEHKNKIDVITSNADCRPNHGTELTTVTAATTIVTTALENAEERIRADKKQRSKKEKKRDRNGEDKAKARRKRLNRQEARDSQRMEDIFGPLSDDVDDGPSNTFFNRFGNMTSENSAYASDSDGGRSPLDMDRVRRKTEKKRRHQPEDENSVDLAEAGREIEAKLLGIPNSPKTASACTTEPNDHDVFRFTDDNDSVEPSTPSTVQEKVKEKKKKRKKSKEERSRKDYHHHHHHHHHHHEKSGELPYLGAEPSPPRASSPLVSKTISPSLPTSRETLLSPIPKATSNVPSITSPIVTGSIQTPKSEKKKDKLIPGFGIEIDETIHENAVKSISEPEERDSNCQSRSGREEPEVPVSTTPTQGEDKPRVAISQEETEDAVAALLEETWIHGSSFDTSYEGQQGVAEADGVAETPAEAPQEDVEEMQQAVESLNASTGEGDTDLKPDTPQSEHDLQIDTDTEEDPNYETVDLTQPPKTPDIPSFYKSPTKTLPMAPILATSEKPSEIRLLPIVTKPQSPPSVIAHSWSLNEHNKSREPVKSHQLKTNESDTDVTSPERTPQRTSTSPPPPQYKQPMLVPCSVPITSDVPKPLSVPCSRPSPIAVQPLYQRLPVSPQSQMVPMRQASPKMQSVTTVSCSSSSNTTPLPPLVPSRMPPLVPSQPSPRVSQPLSPNGQWSRNPTLTHVPNVGKRKPSPPPTKIAVCVPIPAHRPETPVQQIYSTAATQQPVIQHASGMLAPAPGYPRGGLPPLTLNIPPRPYMPVPPLASGIQVKGSRDASLSGKSVIETLLPVNPNEPSQRLDEPKLSPAVIPEPTNKASTSPKVPSPNQPPTYIPETAKIEINASTSSPVFGKPAYVTDNYTMSRTQKQISITDSNLLSPRQKQEVSNLQLLTTHVPRSSTPSPVIVAHGQSHLLHKSVHPLGPPTVSSPNQPLIKTVVPIVPQQITPNAAPPVSSDKCVIPQTPAACQRQSPVSQSQIVKSHIPLVSTVSQTIITRVVPSTVSSVSTPSINEQSTPECLESCIIQGQQLELDAEAQISQTAQPMQLTPPIQPTQPIDEIKKEPVDIEEDTMDKAAYNMIAESENKHLNLLCVKEEDVKQEKKEVINTEIAPCISACKVEPVDTVVPKLEKTELIPVKLEPVNEIKEEETVKETDEVELDEEPVEDPLKEPSTDPLAIDSKEDPTDSKEDSDYWSAKEVNIESVIKKVDALCDGEGNDGDDEAQQSIENVNSDSHDTSKNESDWFDTESTEGESKKNFISVDDHDESVETCENECTRSRRGRTKSRRGSRGGVTTRRGGRNASAISHRRGGRSSRGSKHHVEKNKLPADVYEFHDDSEEDNAGRPRLILTIKSPGPNITGPNAQLATPVAAVKEVPPEEFVSPAANTRKSRRLAERDGSRNTVDDVIEDVVRGSPTNKGLISGNAGNVHATRRSTRHNNIPRNTAQQPIVPLTELRKSPRGNRKAARRTSENNDDSGEEKMKEITATPQETPIKEEPKLVEPESPKVEEPPQAVTPAPLKTVSHEPMALIDPVTGMLIPMRESEEGQYIPVSTTSGQTQATNRALGEARSSGLPAASPMNEAPRAKPVSESSVLVPGEPKKEAVIEHASCQPTPTQQIQPQTSVITKPQSPAVQVTSTITVAQSSTTGTTIVTTVTTTAAPTTTAQPISTSSSQPSSKPTSLKAHVLNASKLVTSAQQQVITKPVAPSLPNQTIVQNIKPPAQPIQGLNLQIPPGRVVSPSLSPRAKQTAPLTPTNGKQGQPMSPVLNNTGAPPNPKQHLLQAAKQQTSTIVNMPQKLPLNIHPASVNISTPTPRIHQPVSQPTALKGINGQPHPLNPKTHLLQAVVPPIGTVASSPTQPHLVNPQISTVVNSVRPPGPKAPTTGPMEPQKVEVPMSGCIMVPTASPQSRSVPIPTYEAPLHGSTGATTPGGQYGLVPPHRSQSPPLPPPAHHHANTSQSEVVNHYGGLARDYLHSQMFQYQYLRAQQEALTAPRITYHIPGTRSPHLPLDPKLEPGIEDSHSPPLELRRGTRTPQDRTTDSPQIAQVYMLHGGMRPLPPPPPQYNTGSNPSLSGAPAGARANFYEPPPAHLHSQYPMAASEAPPEMGRAPTPDRCRKHQVVTPPLYASQVPPQADSFQMLLQRHPVMWQGLLALKNDQAAVQMHFVFGNPRVARDSLPCNSDGSTPPLRIAQRMRLEQTQVEGVARKMQTEDEHCMLLALPCGRDEVDVLQQSKNLQSGFIMYLQQKQAAGIVNIAAPGSQQAAYVVHIFPSCDFARETLARIAPDLHHRVAKIAHLLIVIATV